MIQFIVSNLGTILVSALLLLIVGLAVYKMVRDAKDGKSSCAGCPGSCGGGCHGAEGEE